jgi:hypothetical protein
MIVNYPNEAVVGISIGQAEDLGKLHEQLQDIKEPNQVLVAINILGKQTYQGTVDPAVAAKRHKKNKAAKKARRASRK